MIFRILAICALVSPIFFPWYYTLALTGIAIVRYPAVALAVALEVSVLYAANGVSALSIVVLWGVLVMVIAMLVRHFVYTHLTMP